MDFHGIDLNLLVAFDALMNERNVTRAATGGRQPAGDERRFVAITHPVR